MAKQVFNVLIERDEDGYYVAEVPALRACYTQAKTLPELKKRIKEVIQLCLETQKEARESPSLKFVSVEKVEIEA